MLKQRTKPKEFNKILTDMAISERTSFYLMAIRKKLDLLHVKPPQGATWRKMSEISPMINRSNVKMIFGKVLTCTHEELKLIIKTEVHAVTSTMGLKEVNIYP